MIKLQNWLQFIYKYTPNTPIYIYSLILESTISLYILCEWFVLALQNLQYLFLLLIVRLQYRHRMFDPFIFFDHFQLLKTAQIIQCFRTTLVNIFQLMQIQNPYDKETIILLKRGFQRRVQQNLVASVIEQIDELFINIQLIWTD